MFHLKLNVSFKLNNLKKKAESFLYRRKLYTFVRCKYCFKFEILEKNTVIKNHERTEKKYNENERFRVYPLFSVARVFLLPFPLYLFSAKVLLRKSPNLASKVIFSQC